MVNKYFTVDVIPDIVHGDISDVYTGGTGVDLTTNDLVSDWTAVDVPKGVNILHSISLLVNNEDAGAGSSGTDFVLLFAKSKNGIAPASIQAASGGFGVAPEFNGSIRDNIIGGLKIEGTSQNVMHHVPILDDFSGFSIQQVGGGSFAAFDMGDATVGSATTPALPMVIDLESISGSNVGFDTLYVAVLCFTGTASFETNVLADYSSGAPADNSTTTIVVKTTDPRKLFSIGDSVYNGTQNNDTAIGVVKSLTATSIELEANNVGAIVDGDELINGNPIRIKLGFER